MGDHALLIYPPHGQGATSDVDNAEAFAFAFYEINLHLHFESNQKHYILYIQISLDA